MKKYAWITFFGVLVIALGYAQSSLSISPGSTLASCPAPSAKALIFCNVAGDPSNPDGAYVSANGAAYSQVSQGAAQSGVTSFNKRTGAVVPAAGDYSYSQLASPPTTVTCSTFTQSNSGVTMSGCVVK